MSGAVDELHHKVREDRRLLYSMEEDDESVIHADSSEVNSR